MKFRIIETHYSNMTLTFHLEVKLFGLFWVRYDKTQTFSYIEDARKYIEHLFKPKVKETKRKIHPEKLPELTYVGEYLYQVQKDDEIFFLVKTPFQRYVVVRAKHSGKTFNTLQKCLDYIEKL